MLLSVPAQMEPSMMDISVNHVIPDVLDVKKNQKTVLNV
jgi:hypothetical protein